MTARCSPVALIFFNSVLCAELHAVQRAVLFTAANHDSIIVSAQDL